MHINRRYLSGEEINIHDLSALPVRSEKIEEIFRRVKRRVEK